MLSQFTGWVSRMIYLTIFLALLLQILPKKSYRSYIKFFAGLIFVVSLFQPLISLIGNEDLEDAVTSRITELEESVKQEEEIDLSGIEERQQELLENFASADESE